MHAFVVCVGYLPRTRHFTAENGIEESGFADTGITCEQCHFVGKERFDGHVEILGADSIGWVADRFIERTQVGEFALLLGRKQVYLVEYQHRRNTVRLACGQESVNESGGSLGVIERNNQCHLVQIGGEDMTLLAQVGRTANDIVLALLNIGYPTRAVGERFHRHIIAHSHRIRRTNTTNAEVAFDMALLGAAVLKINEVGAAGRFDD